MSVLDRPLRFEPFLRPMIWGGRSLETRLAKRLPGAEAYGSTAVRSARGKHFPAGKAGTTVVTIPVN